MKTLEKLIIRSWEHEAVLTPDGAELLPYIKNIYHGYRELTEKRKEMEGIQNAAIRIGTFASRQFLEYLTEEYGELNQNYGG
ncbi:hypothetical protein ABFV83_11665 [Lacrimispora sp. BS-2]|uniref:LysR family transcriptional regulator n=1 Tax=Lacrimispora sp. BS-2 TaxID=3151850 RepID=A0AAU7PK50_9FIRM